MHIKLFKSTFNFFNFIYFKFIHSEREQAGRDEGQRARERERGRERIPSRLHTVLVEIDVGLELPKHETMT